jgi:hypothetical protein
MHFMSSKCFSFFFCSSFVMTYCSELRSVREFCRRREGRGSETWFRLSIDSLQHRVVTGNRYDLLALFSFPYRNTFFFPSYSSYYVCCAYREFRPSIPPVSSFDRVTDSVFILFFRMSSRHSTMLKEAVGVFSILILMATGEFIDTFIFLFLF